MKTPGTFVVSLDFELMWGMFDKVTLESYGENLSGVHTAIPRTLDLFSKYTIHATWATVGMLMYPSKHSMAADHPVGSKLPQYENKLLSAYEHLRVASIDARDPHYFAPDLVRHIIDTPGQELASHTFSHYYCREQQASENESFAADCASMAKAALQFDRTLTSMVFPRNQWSAEALTTLTNLGFTAFRGTEEHFIYRARSEANKTNLVLRGLRFLDRYLTLTGHHTYKLTDHNHPGDTLLNIPSSRQLIPYSRQLRLFEAVRLMRIKRSMTRAAKRGEIFHLWWHPHNFGVHQEQNFALLTNLLDHYQHLQEKYDMQSMNMCELTKL